MVLVKLQSCPAASPPLRRSSLLPMGNDDSCPSRSSAHYSHLYSGTPERKRRPSTFHQSSGFNPLSKWMLPLTYGLAVISCLTAYRRKGSLGQLSADLNSELDLLRAQKDETSRLLGDIKNNKDTLSRQRNKLKTTHDRFQHEERVKEELYELRHSAASHADVVTLRAMEAKHESSGVAMSWIEDRQEALYHKIYSLQEYVQDQSRQNVVKKYGEGPHRVQFDVESHSDNTNHQFVVELAPVNLVPHAIETFLDMVTNNLWDNTVFYHHTNLHHVVAAAPVNYGTFETKHYHFNALGYNGLSFPEYSPEFPHDQYTLGFSGIGPNFYINTLDNSDHHGPGGQFHHALPSDADPCFGKIIKGKKVLDLMMPGLHEDIEDPVSWSDFDLTRIVKIELLRDD